MAATRKQLLAIAVRMNLLCAARRADHSFTVTVELVEKWAREMRALLGKDEEE